VLYQPTTGVETIMTYEQALDYEQEQRLEQGRLSEEYRQAEDQYDRMKVGNHPLCSCGLKQAQDCECDRPF
jgi:hypothetical protein